MGIFNSLSRRVRRHRATRAAGRQTGPTAARTQALTRRRQCHIEPMEPRQMLAADLLLGSVYFEEATGNDTAGDVIQVTFEGGAAGTTLDHLVIDGDKARDGGLSSGDVFFDTTDGGLGAFGAVGLSIVGHDGFEIVGLHVADGGTRITFDFRGFDAGEILEFSVDADEAQYVAGNDIDTNALVEGGEFQRSILTGLFSAPRYEDATLEAIYWDAFDDRFAQAETAAGNRLNLPNDRYDTQHDFTDRTAGAIAHVGQTPLPTIAGTVFHDHNLNNQQNAGTDEGIANVELALWVWDDGLGDYRDTGMREFTGAVGDYLFEDHGGSGSNTTFSLIGGDLKIEALAAGDAANGTEIQFLQEAGIPAAFPLAEYNGASRILTITVSESALTRFAHIDTAITALGFAVTSSSLVGYFDPTVDGQPTGTLTGGSMRLMPGRYQVREAQPSPYFSVGATAGTINGMTEGVVLSPDVISQIDLAAGEHSIDNDFAEALPASIRGCVYEDDNDDGVMQRGTEAGIAGVDIIVRSVSAIDGSTVVRHATTSPEGCYFVENLVPGEYTVEEVATPTGYYDGKDAAGTVDGTVVGSAINPGDNIVGVTLGGGDDGIEYNFGELRPASISGRVHLNTDGDCDFAPGDVLMQGVQVDLLSADGSTLLATVYTNEFGEYTFDGLAPGEYQVREHTPATYNGRAIFDGADHVGTAGGEIAENDHISKIVLAPATTALHYDFCEHIGAAISGWVYHDANNDGVFDPGENGLGTAVVELLDADGNPTGVTTTTRADAANLGYYEFTNLGPGIWGVAEIPPAGYLDGLDAAGTHGGNAVNPGDTITGALLGFADFGRQYNFGEIVPASISGRVHANVDGDCDFEPDNGDFPLAGIRVDLLDADGNLLDTQQTDANGDYRFDGLPPGEYQVFEHQPDAYNGLTLYDGSEHVGTAGGVITENDKISRVVLTSGTDGLRYDFCEHIGVSLSGYVYHDASNEGSFDPGEDPIAGVTLKLLDADGNDTGVRAVTDANGFYEFTGLAAGTYGVMEVHPPEWLDGIDTPGNRGGSAEPSPPGDMLTGAVLLFGRSGVNYNFGELLPGSIQGRVGLTTTEDCHTDPNATPLEGITVDLLDEEGNILATTTTDAFGSYQFTRLRLGHYTVHEHQPLEYFDGNAWVGSGGGSILDTNTLADIEIHSGDVLVNYDYCEHPAASISGYVFQDGPTIVTNADLPDDISTIRDGLRTPDDRPLAGVVIQLHSGTSTEPIYGYQGLPGRYAFGEPIRTVTDANGYYEFTGLPAGTYSVVEVQPGGFVDGLDTHGSNGGHAINPRVQKTLNIASNPGLQETIDAFQEEFGNDAIVGIPLAAGQHAALNNFSEIVTEPFWIPPNPDPDPDPKPLPPPVVPYLPNRLLPQLAPPELVQPFIGSSLRVWGFTWHLSVIDGGFPRSVRAGKTLGQFVGSHFDTQAWEGADMNAATWTRADTSGNFPTYDQPLTFGNEEAVPVAGDWNGDGVTEIGIFLNGEWFLDMNGNGVWDEGDLWAKLGAEGDRPVVGDWDGDGKTDIGIFGPAWPGDPRALAYEPGLPDPLNVPRGKAKNVPPEKDEATHGTRKMKATSGGRLRADLIDHVFHYGKSDDRPVTGDWNGDGVTTIGIFRGGIWYIDADGDGRFTRADGTLQYGAAGDLPVVGDWNGDGVDDLGVYRAGRWVVDSDGDRELTAHDRVFELGTAGDLPAVGDWNGDGIDEPSVYHPGGEKILLGRKAM